MERTTDAVFMTGATGFVGMELLARYLERTDRRVYALVRGADDHEVQARMEHTLHGLFGPAHPYAQRVVAVRGDVAQPGLGIAAGLDWLAGRGERDRARRGVGVLRARAADRAGDQRGRHAARARIRRALPRSRRPATSVLRLHRVRRRRARGLLQRGRPRSGPALSQRLRAVEVRGGAAGLSRARSASDHDLPPEHHRGRARQRLDGVVQRALLAAARVLARDLFRAARAR